MPTDIDRDLFDALRDVRLRLARERGVPPYVIFHDTTLKEMVERRPKTIDDIINQTVGRCLDLFDIDSGLVKRWQGGPADTSD